MEKYPYRYRITYFDHSVYEKPFESFEDLKLDVINLVRASVAGPLVRRAEVRLPEEGWIEIDLAKARNLIWLMIGVEKNGHCSQ